MGRTHRDTNSPRDHPRSDFYDIIQREDGLTDIYLKDFSGLYAMRGIVMAGRTREELEEDIRRRFTAYMEAAEVIYL